MNGRNATLEPGVYMLWQRARTQSVDNCCALEQKFRMCSFHIEFSSVFGVTVTLTDEPLES